MNRYDELNAEYYERFATNEQRACLFDGGTPDALRGVLLRVADLRGYVRIWHGDPDTGLADDPRMNDSAPCRVRVLLEHPVTRPRLVRIPPAPPGTVLPLQPLYLATRTIVRLDYAPEGHDGTRPGLTLYLHPDFDHGLEDTLLVGESYVAPGVERSGWRVELPLDGDEDKRAVLSSHDSMEAAGAALDYYRGDRFGL